MIQYYGYDDDDAGGDLCDLMTVLLLSDCLGAPVLFNIRDVRNRHCVNLNVENTKTFSNDPEDPSAAALKVCRHHNNKTLTRSI